MRLTIAAVGRLKDGAERVLVDRYAKRLAAGKAVGIGPLREIEIAESRLAAASGRQADEAKRLLRQASDADVIAVLDERGKALTSAAFASWLAACRDDGRRHAAFLVGGSDGHGAPARSAAHLLLSLGPMTLPHGLARVLLCEQLYRAVTILAGHPYHRD